MKKLFEYIKRFEDIFDYPTEYRRPLENGFHKINGNELAKTKFVNLLKCYQQNNFSIEKYNEEISKIAELIQERSQLILVVVYICLSDSLLEKYTKKGLPYLMWFNAMCDIKDRIFECKEVYGFIGSSTDWFARFFNFSLYAIGRLQFNYSTIISDYSGKEYSLKKGEKVVGVHVPRGKELNKNSVIESFKAAEDFFRTDFIDGKIPFVCKTYLFHKSMVDCYKKDSNLLWFYNLFDIFYENDTPGNPDLWRIFGQQTTNYRALAERTSLQRELKKYLLAGNNMGIAAGILRKEKIDSYEN